MLKLTLVLSYIISFSFSSLMTNLLMFSVALFLILSLAFLGVFSVTFLFIFSFTLLFRYFLTLLLCNRFTPGNLDSMAFLSWFIPALLFPDCITGRNTTVGTPNQKQQSQYLHAAFKDDFTLPM